MSPLEQFSAVQEVQTLMDIVVGVAEFTHYPARYQEVPEFLSRALQLTAISLGIVKKEGSDPAFILHHWSNLPQTEEGVIRRNLLAIFQEARLPLKFDGSDDVWQGMVSQCYSSAAKLDEIIAAPQALAFAHPIDRQHWMVLIAHKAAEDPPITPDAGLQISLLARELARQLRPFVSWHTSPGALGSPFNTLTEGEWSVVRALSSDACEKQLADKLHMSPHTLHSHIKRIYRKVGVQGRLSLLSRLNAAIRQLRIRTLQFRPVDAYPEGTRMRIAS